MGGVSACRSALPGARPARSVQEMAQREGEREAAARDGDALLSSGQSSRSRGTVGSTNGRGVSSSTKTGMLMATLEPRRRRMLAVRVLCGEEWGV